MVLIPCEGAGTLANDCSALWEVLPYSMSQAGH